MFVSNMRRKGRGELDRRARDKELKEIWEKVWRETNEKNYSTFREHKTKDKIKMLMELGVDFTGKRVLDVGCGNGATLCYLREQFGITGIGIDIVEEALSRARTRCTKDLKDALEFVVGDHRNIKLPDESVDIVLSWGVIEHFVEYLLALYEACRVLKKGGTLVLIQPHFWSFGAIQMCWLRFTGRWRFGKQKHFSHTELKHILLSLGFAEVLHSTKAPYKDMPLVRVADNFVKKICPFWGHYLYVVARK